MKFYKIKNIFLSNILLLISFLSLIELIFGKWFLFNTPVTKVPAAPFARKIKRDVSKLYGLNKRHLISNIRDKRGYRKLQNYMKKPVILTIGGSTTAQTAVDENFTWQSTLSKKLNKKFSVVNGGVSGQSAFGHLHSLENWHSKSFSKDNVKYIIYYFGVNDTKIYKSVPSYNEYESDAYANDRYWKIKSQLIRYSFFYTKLQEIRDIYFSDEVDSTNIFGYHSNSKRFGDINKKIEINGVNFDDHIEYINLLKKLSAKTKILFPTSEVFWVQQSIPGCRFENPKLVNDIHLLKSNICIDLAKVYLLQDYALSGKDSNLKKNIIKMYLDNPITTAGVFDSMHTNEIGSEEIGNYLYDNIFKNLDLK